MNVLSLTWYISVLFCSILYLWLCVALRCVLFVEVDWIGLKHIPRRWSDPIRQKKVAKPNRWQAPHRIATFDSVRFNSIQFDRGLDYRPKPSQSNKAHHTKGRQTVCSSADQRKTFHDCMHARTHPRWVRRGEARHTNNIRQEASDSSKDWTGLDFTDRPVWGQRWCHVSDEMMGNMAWHGMAYILYPDDAMWCLRKEDHQ